MKPHISKLGGKRWMCRGMGDNAIQYGIGDTPAMAYWEWWCGVLVSKHK